MAAKGALLLDTATGGHTHLVGHKNERVALGDDARLKLAVHQRPHVLGT